MKFDLLNILFFLNGRVTKFQRTLRANPVISLQYNACNNVTPITANTVATYS